MSGETYVVLFVNAEILIIVITAHDSFVLLIFSMIKSGPFANIRCFGRQITQLVEWSILNYFQLKLLKCSRENNILIISLIAELSFVQCVFYSCFSFIVVHGRESEKIEERRGLKGLPHAHRLKWILARERARVEIQ